MMMDSQALFCEKLAVTAAAASTNQLKVGAVDFAKGSPRLSLVVVCTDDMTDASSDSTLAVTLRTDSDVAMGSPTTLATIGTFPAASKAGTRLVYDIPQGLAFEDYVDIYFTPANGNLTTGKFTAWIGLDVQGDHAFPAGYSMPTGS